jgi:hypothetical protein
VTFSGRIFWCDAASAVTRRLFTFNFMLLFSLVSYNPPYGKIPASD